MKKYISLVKLVSLVNQMFEDESFWSRTSIFHHFNAPDLSLTELNAELLTLEDSNEHKIIHIHQDFNDNALYGGYRPKRSLSVSVGGVNFRSGEDIEFPYIMETDSRFIEDAYPTLTEDECETIRQLMYWDALLVYRFLYECFSTLYDVFVTLQLPTLADGTDITPMAILQGWGLVHELEEDDRLSEKTGSLIKASISSTETFSKRIATRIEKDYRMVNMMLLYGHDPIYDVVSKMSRSWSTRVLDLPLFMVYQVMRYQTQYKTLTLTQYEARRDEILKCTTDTRRFVVDSNRSYFGLDVSRGLSGYDRNLINKVLSYDLERMKGIAEKNISTISVTRLAPDQTGRVVIVLNKKKLTWETAQKEDEKHA